MKILYVTTVGGTMGFFKTFIKMLVEEGHTVDIATNEKDYPVPSLYYEIGCGVYHIDTSRSPFKIGNLKAIRQIKKIVSKKQYDIVHCHTPIAAVCTRIACRKTHKAGTRVMYTAHGFHFYKGAPKKNWMLYYPVEKLCARFTDVLLTINSEDYAFAKEKLRTGRVEYIPGVGIDNESFYGLKRMRDEKKEYFGIPKDAPVILSVGELNSNKNHETVVRALAALENDDAHYVIAGKGDLFDKLVYLSRSLGVEDRVHLLGYREDVREIYGIADVFAHPSFREGLPVSVIEAMAAGLPVVASNIRGNVDLIDRDGGVLLQPKDVEGFAEAIDKLIVSYKTRKDMGDYNREKAEKYSTSAVVEGLREIYTQE